MQITDAKIVDSLDTFRQYFDDSFSSGDTTTTKENVIFLFDSPIYNSATLLQTYSDIKQKINACVADEKLIMNFVMYLKQNIGIKVKLNDDSLDSLMIYSATKDGNCVTENDVLEYEKTLNAEDVLDATDFFKGMVTGLINQTNSTAVYYCTDIEIYNIIFSNTDIGEITKTDKKIIPAIIYKKTKNPADDNTYIKIEKLLQPINDLAILDVFFHLTALTTNTVNNGSN